MIVRTELGISIRKTTSQVAHDPADSDHLDPITGSLKLL